MEEYFLARYRAKFPDETVNSEPFLLSEGSVLLTKAKELRYVIKVGGAKFQTGLGDLSDALGLNLPNKMSLEEAQNSLQGKCQIVKGEWVRV